MFMAATAERQAGRYAAGKKGGVKENAQYVVAGQCCKRQCSARFQHPSRAPPSPPPNGMAIHATAGTGASRRSRQSRRTLCRNLVTFHKPPGGRQASATRLWFQTMPTSTSSRFRTPITPTTVSTHVASAAKKTRCPKDTNSHARKRQKVRPASRAHTPRLRCRHIAAAPPPRRRTPAVTACSLNYHHRIRALVYRSTESRYHRSSPRNEFTVPEGIEKHRFRYG